MHLAYEVVNRSLSHSFTQKASFKLFQYVTRPESTIKTSLIKTQQGVS